MSISPQNGHSINKEIILAKKREIARKKLDEQRARIRAVRPEKRCVSCGETKSMDRYGTHPTSVDGFTANCKDCRATLHKSKRNIDDIFRLRHHISTRINTIHGRFSGTLEDALGYPLWKLKKSLQILLKENEGITLREAFNKDYHLDHIRPIASFALDTVGDDTFRECWAIDNLKMIPAEENLAKGARYSPDNT